MSLFSLFNYNKTFAQLSTELIQKSLQEYTSDLKVSTTILNYYKNALSFKATNINIKNSTILQNVSDTDHYLISMSSSFYTSLTDKQTQYVQNIIQSAIKGATGGLVSTASINDQSISMTNSILSQMKSSVKYEEEIKTKIQNILSNQTEIDALENITVEGSDFKQIITSDAQYQVILNIVNQSVMDMSNDAVIKSDAQVTTGSTWVVIATVIALIIIVIIGGPLIAKVFKASNPEIGMAQMGMGYMNSNLGPSPNPNLGPPRPSFYAPASAPPVFYQPQSQIRRPEFQPSQKYSYSYDNLSPNQLSDEQLTQAIEHLKNEQIKKKMAQEQIEMERRAEEERVKKIQALKEQENFLEQEREREQEEELPPDEFRGRTQRSNTMYNLGPEETFQGGRPLAPFPKKIKKR